MKPRIPALLFVFVTSFGSQGFAQTPTVAELDALSAEIDVGALRDVLISPQMADVA